MQVIAATLCLHCVRVICYLYVARVNNSWLLLVHSIGKEREGRENEPDSNALIYKCTLNVQHNYDIISVCLYVRVAVSNADSDNPSKEIEVAMTSVVKQPLHVTLRGRISIHVHAYVYM